MLKLSLILLCALSSSVSVPAKGGPRLAGGQLYKFGYSTEVLLDRARGRAGGSAGGSAGYRISSAVDISLAWRNPGSKDDQLLRVAISDVKIENATPRPDEDNIFLDTPTQRILGTANLEALERPFLVHLKLGKVKGLYSYQKELTAIRNLKRGVASLLQLQLTSGKTQEVDASGRCMVEYTAGKDHVTRVKAVDTCKTLETGFTTHSQVLGVSGKSSSITEFTLEDGFVKTAVSEETHVLSVNARHSAAAKVVSRQTLTLVSKEAGPQEATGQDVPSVVQSLDGEFVSVSVLPERVKTKCKTCPTLWEHWQAVHKQLEPEGLSKAAATRNFLSLIHSVRKSTKEDILKVMKNCSKTALPQMVDVVTSAQTPASLDAVLSFLNFSDAGGLVLQERFLYACGFSSHPNQSMLQALLDLWKRKIGSTEIRESVMIIMGALVRKLCQKGGCELPAVLEVKKLLLEGPGSSEEEEKVQMYLLALKNAMLPEAVPLLTQFSESEVGALSTIAITALQRYDRALITDEVKQTLNRVYHQNRRIYEKNVRAAAADVIFSSDPSYMEVKNLLLSIGDLPHEMNKYMLSKVHDILRFEMPASAMVRRVMKDMISHNYDRFSKVGSSSAYSGFMARAEDVTSTYSLDILYSGSGILRRSNMNIHAFSQGAHLHGLQVAIEAQGLESLIGATADEGEEDLESFAGMSAVLFDVQLRPVTFFKGYSDLMSKMFSLSSDPMNVVKGLILLTDHSQVIRLQSGLKASVEFQGGLAIDISGGMEFSLWYRESKTSVNNRGALVVVGSVAVDMDLMRAAVEVSFETEASLDFITTVQFSEYPFLVCMQMDKATFPLREFVVKQESLWTGKTFASRRGRKELVPGSEFPLHQENSNMCKRVFDESW
ncbi:microsomal triglyceride transfer protein large subunit [Anguilla anguilla]|uniref:microsomal triglyceride transfer protein large subunit n=1 Tax=Anguilla anguilla TaxID=7936 RepID=UPI0015ADA3E4|nr:microsomal triglyceride transfer protein large subunit [Anguilla anguilla]